MDKTLKWLQRTGRFLFLRRELILFWFFIWAVLLFNSVHNSYPDEFDNILGGWLILRGSLPYVGYFAHHAPLGYFLSAVIELFGRQSFVHFRFITTFVYLGIFLFAFKKLLHSSVAAFKPYLLVFFGIIAISSTYFWGNMFLADNLSAYLIIPAFGLVTLKLIFERQIEKRDLFVVSASTFLTILTSTTFLYVAAILNLVAFVMYLKPQLKDFSIKRAVKPFLEYVVIFSVPYLFFLLYLVVTGSLKDFYYDVFIYNSKYYIYNYPGNAANGINPIRYAIAILNNFINSYQILLSQILGINFRFPFNTTLALANTALWVYLAIRKKWSVLFVSFFCTALATVRNNPAESRETDYQSAVYFVTSFFNSAIFFYLVKEGLHESRVNSEKVVAGFLFVLVGVFWFFNALFVSTDLWRISYSRYMGQLPLIYDRPQVAGIINSIVPKDHYCWVGPFEFEENFYLNCKLPSKYTWILPQYANSPELMAGVLSEYDAKKADVIVFSRDFSAFFQTSDFNKFFTPFLDKNYVRLADISGFKDYKFKNSPTKNFNLDASFNFLKPIAPELATKLLSLGYLEKSH